MLGVSTVWFVFLVQPESVLTATTVSSLKYMLVPPWDLITGLEAPSTQTRRADVCVCVRVCVVCTCACTAKSLPCPARGLGESRQSCLGVSVSFGSRARPGALRWGRDSGDRPRFLRDTSGQKE